MNSQLINRLFVGIALIGIGILFLLNQAGIIAMDIWDLIWDFWPVPIIYFSAVGLLFQRRMNSGWSGSYFWNLIAFVAGWYFLGRNLGVISLSIGDLLPYVIPVALILFGVQLIVRPGGEGKRRSERGRRHKERDRRPIEADDPTENIPDWAPPAEPISNFDEQFEARFGRIAPEQDQAAEAAASRPQAEKRHDPDPEPGAKHAGRFGYRWHEQAEHRSGFITDIKIGNEYFELKPMNVSLFIGDTVIDLTRARIPVGETKINISTFIGDVKIYLPNDLDLEVCVVSSSFLGDSHVLDRREGGLFRNVTMTTPGYHEAEKRLRIHVSVFIGDLTVQRVG
jgi:lia operon protein LiaF